jgi:hypothetical protein
MMDDKKPQDYETAKVTLKNIWSFDSRSPYETSRRLWNRKFIWDGNSDAVLMVETIRATETFTGGREREDYNYEIHISFNSLPENIKMELQNCEGSPPFEFVITDHRELN